MYDNVTYIAQFEVLDRFGRAARDLRSLRFVLRTANSDMIPFMSLSVGQSVAATNYYAALVPMTGNGAVAVSVRLISAAEQAQMALLLRDDVPVSNATVNATISDGTRELP